MNNNLLKALLLSAGMTAMASNATAVPPSTAFTYQGALADNGTPTNGPTSMSFKLWDAAAGGSQVGPTINSVIDVDNGVFSKSLDFGAGSYTDNQALWLEILVEGQSLGRTPMSATPYSLSTRGIEVAENGTVTIRSSGSSFATSAFLREDSTGGYMQYLKNNGGAGVSIGMNDVNNHLWGIGTNQSGNGLGNGQFYIYDSASTTSTTVFTVQRGTGNVGIGTQSPTEKLHIKSPSAKIRIEGEVNPQVDMRFISTNGDWQVGTIGSSSSDNIFFINDKTLGDPANTAAFVVSRSSGNVGIGTTTPATALDVNGAVTIRGGADIVEGFDSVCGTAFEPGTVLVIDPENPGKLMCSEDAYDYKVAGVVSGANGVKPGIKLGQDGVMDGEIPVAMTGRVYVKCSSENGVIRAGDRLTTASLRGHAMKATDTNLSDGAVIGKAMSDLDESTGMVLVLVNLQ
ncbi:MAG: hypothetical protein RLN78_07700 [Phycisphaerales bacterium]